jgi:putative transposase
MNKKVNQTFVQIPFTRLIQMITYKAEECGISVITTEESYTSGTSFLDHELPVREFYNKKRRIHRGLFRSNSGHLINADVNGSLQIMKKVFPNAFANGIEGVALQPVVVNSCLI